MDVPIPNVSRNDVLRIVRREYSHKIRDDVLRIVAGYGTARWHEGVDRVHLAILKLADGNPERLTYYVRIAGNDPRNVLYPAENPQLWKIGFVGADKLTGEEQERLVVEDWSQYQDWLNAECSPGAQGRLRTGGAAHNRNRMSTLVGELLQVIGTILAVAQTIVFVFVGGVMIVGAFYDRQVRIILSVTAAVMVGIVVVWSIRTRYLATRSRP